MTRRIAILMCLLLAGCGFLKRGPANQLFSLDTIESVKTPLAGAPIGIDGIELPPGLDRKEIVVRGADHRFEVRGAQLWAASLEEMVIHTLAFDLAGRLPEGMVVLPGQAKPATMRSIYVTFEDLAAGPDGTFVLDARWTVGTETRHERITVAAGSKDSTNIAAAMSQALAQFADRIVAQLSGISPAAARPAA